MSLSTHQSASARSRLYVEAETIGWAFVLASELAHFAEIAITGVEATGGGEAVLFIEGPLGDLDEALAALERLAEQHGFPAPVTARLPASSLPPAVFPPSKTLHNGITQGHDFIPSNPNRAKVATPDTAMKTTSIGILETQGYAALLEATDAMMKAGDVSVLGKEKIGAAYVTVVISGEIAAVQAALQTGAEVVERIGGKLILARVIARPHDELLKLLPETR